MDEATRRRRHFRNRPRSGRQAGVSWHVVVDGAAAGEERTAHTRDISVGGAFIVTDEPEPRGTRLRVTLHLAERAITVDAEVRWLADEDEPARGMGVRFHGLSVEQAQEINRFQSSFIETVDHDDLA